MRTCPTWATPVTWLRSAPDMRAIICCRGNWRSRRIRRTCAHLSIRKGSRRSAALAIKEKIEAFSLTLHARAGEEGELFGSITNIDIERAIREKGLDIERRKIHLPEPIKQLGEFTVPVKLDSEVEASLKITVAAQAD